MREVDTIVIHAADTPPSMDIGRDEIDKWHRKRGFLMIGYHYVIRRDGTLEYGRPLEQVGAHVRGHNATSIGICLVGGMSEKEKGKPQVPEANFTRAQWDTLRALLRKLKEALYPNAEVRGHNEFDSSKACPTFDVQDMLHFLLELPMPTEVDIQLTESE